MSAVVDQSVLAHVLGLIGDGSLSNIETLTRAHEELGLSYGLVGTLLGQKRMDERSKTPHVCGEGTEEGA